MLYSNQRFFDIPHEEFVAQQAQLSEMRDEHYQQLVEFGTAERLIGSTALSNLRTNKSALTEGSLLYPFRHPQWNIPSMRAAEYYADARIKPRSPGVRGRILGDPLLDLMGDQNRENYVFFVGRDEPSAGGGYSTSGYAAGMVNDTVTAEFLGRERYIPFPGMAEADLQLIEKQLSEIAAFAVEKSLAIIDPLTLSEGKGQVIRYDDDDFIEAGY